MKNSIKLLRSYIYVLLWTCYFSFYFLFPNHEIFLYAKNVMIYWDFVLSYFNAIFWLITVLGISNLIIRFVSVVFNKITKKTETELDDIVWNFIIKFLDLIKYIWAVYTFFYLAITPKYIDVIVDKATSVLIIFIFLSLTTSFVNIIFENLLI